jgi:hypothetical protein
MDKEAQVSLLMHAKVMEYRITQMQGRLDLPPIVRLRIQSTKVSIEKLVSAIHEGR